MPTDIATRRIPALALAAALAAAGGPPGASGTDEWAFEVMAPGAATVTTGYGQPWPGGQKNAWTFTAEVSVS